jgi:hypothetical protein|tara:strand:+ start:196 stop:402 length:207 start_codon:yes stop_codon:yes gene_type:complete
VRLVVVACEGELGLHTLVGGAVWVVRHAPAEAARKREAAEAVLGARPVLHHQAEVRLVGVTPMLLELP